MNLRLFSSRISGTVAGMALILVVGLAVPPSVLSSPPGDALDEALELIERFQQGESPRRIDDLVQKLRTEYGRLRIEADHTLRELKDARDDAGKRDHLESEHRHLARQVEETQTLIEWLHELTRPPQADVLGLEDGETIPHDDLDRLARWVDRVLERVWSARQIIPAPAIDDPRFLRRVSLDLVGRVPSLEERAEFLGRPGESRRREWIDRLVESPDYAEHFASIWNAELLGRGYLPDDKHREPFVDWLRREFAANLPHSEFVRQLVAVKESNTKEVSPNAFLSARQADRVANINKITTTFLGLDLRCAQCHDDPYQKWTQDDFHAMAAFLARHREKDTGGNVYKQIDLDKGEATYQTPDGTKHTVGMRYHDGTEFSDFRLDEAGQPLLDEKGQKVPAEKTRREMLVDAMVGDLQLARAQVNRLWAHLFRRGIVDPVDAFHPDNRPTVPLVLDVLAMKFRESGFDNRWLLRVLTRTRAYALDTHLDPEAAPGNTVEARVRESFARYPVKALTGEQAFDSVVTATDYAKTLLERHGDQPDTYRSFKVSKKVPAWKKHLLERREAFLKVYAWDPEKVIDPDLGTIPQALTLANGQLVQDAIAGEKGSRVASLLETPAPDAIRALYHATLVRDPLPSELARFERHVESTESPRAALEDVLWSLVNSAEFRYTH